MMSSPLGIVVGIMIAAVMLMVSIALGFRKYKGNIPLVGSNSVAISVACKSSHGGENGGKDMVLGKMKWDVKEIPESDMRGVDGFDLGSRTMGSNGGPENFVYGFEMEEVDRC